MAYIRTKKRENPFVQLDKYFLEDENLTWGAKGILAYILSKPDNWEIRKEDLVRRSEDGKAKVEAALLNLLANGYIYWYQEKEEDGTFGEWIYQVYERPEFNPELEKCITEGKKRIESKKTKIKERNKKNQDKPKADNQTSVPKADYPTSDNPTPDNQPYSNNDFSNNDFSNKEEEEEESINPIIQQSSLLAKTYTSLIGPINPIIENNLKEWLNKLPFEVIHAEIENCALRGASTFTYIETTLKDDYKLGIKTVEDINNKVAKHKASKQQAVNKPYRGNKNNVKKELVPDWMDKTKEDQPKPELSNNKDLIDRVKMLRDRIAGEN